MRRNTVPEAEAAAQSGAFPEPFDLSLDEFLTGPHSDDSNEIDIDPIFGKSLTQVLRELHDWNPQSLAFDEQSPRCPSLCEEGYSYVEVDQGVLLLAPDGDIAGGYLSCDLAVASDHRGKGLGAELVMQRALRDGELPTWNLDVPAYTPAGLAAHRSAWRQVRARPEMIWSIESELRDAMETDAALHGGPPS